MSKLICKRVDVWAANIVTKSVLISEGMVTVDGEVETRKRKKIIAGQVVAFNGESVTVVAAQ